MFDAERILQDITVQVSAYFSDTLKMLFNSESLPARALTLEDEAWRQAIEQNASLRDEIRLLVRVANGEIPGDLADDLLMGQVEEAIQRILRALFAAPGNPRQHEVPAPFWQTELGEVVRHCQLWLRGDDLITYSEAAGLLWPQEDVQVARMRIRRMVERGHIHAYADPTENNPQHAARVSREEVTAFQRS